MQNIYWLQLQIKRELTMNKLHMISKGIVALIFVMAGLANLLGATAADLTRLGYPEYLGTIIGVAYLIAVVGLYQTKFEFIRQWASAGIVISLIGAAASHLFAGDPIATIVPAVVILAVFKLSIYAGFKRQAV